MSRPKRVLVTGINGFVGHHVADNLRELGHVVIGVGYGEADPLLKNKVQEYHTCDMTSFQEVEKLPMADIDGVIHLAGLADVGMSFKQPGRFVADNPKMVANLLEHALLSKSNGTFLIVSSAVLYDKNEPVPFTEDGKINHDSPYAISKIGGEYLCDYYRSRGLACVSGRPFNHIGPGQKPGFLIPDLAAQLKKLKEEGGDELLVGDLSTYRDYTDVRDVARAYIDIATADHQPKETIYNVCSSISRSGEEMLKELILAFDFKKSPTITKDPKRFRPNDNDDVHIRGSYKRLHDEYGWEPTFSLSQTMKDVVSSLT